MNHEHDLPGVTGDAAPELDDDLADLFQRERRAHAGSPTAKERAWGRLAASLGMGPDGPEGGGPDGGNAASPASAPPASTSPTPSGRWLPYVSLAAAVALGVGAWSHVRGAPPANPGVTHEPVVVATTAPPASSAPTITEAEPSIGVDALPAAKITARSAAPAPATSCAICDERRLLEAARRDLRETAYARALSAVDEHGRRFPHGQLAEERESLRVHALVGAGRKEEAARAASEFHRTFPRSPLSSTVAEAVER